MVPDYTRSIAYYPGSYLDLAHHCNRESRVPDKFIPKLLPLDIRRVVRRAPENNSSALGAS